MIKELALVVKQLEVEIEYLEDIDRLELNSAQRDYIDGFINNLYEEQERMELQGDASIFEAYEVASTLDMEVSQEFIKFVNEWLEKYK